MIDITGRVSAFKYNETKTNDLDKIRWIRPASVMRLEITWRKRAEECENEIRRQVEKFNSFALVFTSQEKATRECNFYKLYTFSFF